MRICHCCNCALEIHFRANWAQLSVKSSYKILMKTNNLWLLALPLAVLAINGCGGGNGSGTPNRTATPIPTVTSPPPPSGIVYDNKVVFSAVSSGSNADKTDLVANQSNITTDTAGTSVLRLTEQMSIIQSRNLRVTGQFNASIVGQNIPIRATPGNGIAMADYEQNDGGTLNRWEATGGTVIIDSFQPSTISGGDAVVRYRLINATFTPSKGSTGTGTFTLNAKGAAN